MKRLIFLLLLPVIGCESYTETEEVAVFGPRSIPIVIEKARLSEIANLPARPLKQPGKIYRLGDLLFINDVGAGVHVIDDRDPRNPRPITFISIPGSHDVAVKKDQLYADNGADLVTLDVSDLSQVKLLSRTPNIFAPPVPPHTPLYLDYDSTRHVIVGWRDTTITKEG